MTVCRPHVFFNTLFSDTLFQLHSRKKIGERKAKGPLHFISFFLYFTSFTFMHLVGMFYPHLILLS